MFKAYVPQQGELLPAHVGEALDPSDPALFIDDLVESLDLRRFGVDPVSWSTSTLGEEDTCGRADHRIRRSTGSRWSTWCEGGGHPEALSREFEPSAQSIWNWVRQAERDEGHPLGRPDDGGEGGAPASPTRAVRVLREEKEILKKAAAWFAQETGSTPRGRSGL